MNALPTSERFLAWYARFTATGDICPVRLGMSREDLHALFGEPDYTGGVSRRWRRPIIWVYGSLEFHFRQGKDELFLIFRDDASGAVSTCIGGISGPERRPS